MSARPARRLRVALALAVLAGALLPAAADAATVTVRIDQGLSPRAITVAPGTTVRWVNESDNRYRMRSRTGPEEFDSGNIEPGESFSFTFRLVGTYPYLDDRDREDPAFHGTVTVAEPASAATTPPSGGSGGGHAQPPAAPTSATVHMAGRTFSPGTITIAAGGSVTFVNDDDREHTATGDAFDTGVLNPGASSTERFPSAGTFSFLCQIHPDMRGTVAVRGSSGAAPPPVATPSLTPTPPPTPPPAEPSAPAAADAGVTIFDFNFDPADLQVAAGTTVTWTNRGAAPHTVTANDLSFDSGVIESGGSFSQTFEAPGRFVFSCALHPEMVGTVVVADAAAESHPPAASPSDPPPLVAGGAAAAPPSAAVEPVPETAPAVAQLQDGALRLLAVGLVTAGTVLAFGVLVVGTARAGSERRAP